MMAPQTWQLGESPRSIRSFRASEAWWWAPLPPCPPKAADEDGAPADPSAPPRDDNPEAFSGRDDKSSEAAEAPPLRMPPDLLSGSVKSPNDFWPAWSGVPAGGALTYLGRSPSKSACCCPVRKRSCSQRKT